MIDPIVIPDHFFDEEIREDFVIHPIMKRCIAADIKVLTEVDRICKKYGFKYFADFGTLLGAVRHNGFIPWDDDIDITMYRSDYMKFMQIASQELPPSYRLSSYATDPDHIQPFMTVINRTDIGQDDSVTSEFYDCPFIVGVEIYPLDAIPANEEERNVQISLYQIVYNCAFYYEDYQADGSLNERLEQVKTFTGVSFNGSTPIRSQLWTLTDQIASMYSPKEAAWLARMYKYAVNEQPVNRKLSWYSDSLEVPFEYVTIPVPVGYHEYLTNKYSDYNIRVRDGASHEYPFFRPQLSDLPEHWIDRLKDEEPWIFE